MDPVGALRREHSELLTLCRDISDADWPAIMVGERCADFILACGQLSSRVGSPRYHSNMSSSRDKIIAALDAADASYRKLAALPLDALTRPEKQALLNRLEELAKKMTALDRRLIGQLITEGDPALFGGAAWADVLSRRLRISRGEAQRRITEARSA